MHYSDQAPLSDLSETAAVVPELTSEHQTEGDGIFVGSALHKKTLTFIRYALLLDAIDEGWLYEQQGWMFNQLQYYHEALDAFDHARHLGYANDGWLYRQKSYALHKLERSDEALEAGERARRLGYVNEE